MRPVRVYDREQHEVLCKILESLQRTERLLMTSLQDFKDGFARIDAATSAIAQKLRDLSGQIGNMSAADEDAAKALLDSAASALEAMGANPDNPVPVPVPEEPTP